MTISKSSLEPEIPEWLGNREWVIERIRTETGRAGTAAYALIEELAQLHPSLRQDVLDWWKHGTIDREKAVHGWSVRRLIEEKRVNYPSEALTWLSHLMIEPEKHLAALERPHSIVIGGWEVPKREPIQ